MTGSGRKRGRLGFVMAGTVMLFNPCINIIDILPDVFGILLILYGISRMADISPDLEEAKKGFEKAAWAGLFALVAMVFSFGADNYTKLSLAFAAWLLECIFIIPAMKKLLVGADDLRVRLVDRGSEEAFSGAATLSSMFFVIRSAMAVIPLSMPLFFEKKEQDIVSGGSGENIESVINAATVICTALSLVMGIVWLVSVLKCFYELRSDKEFENAVLGKYDTEITPDGSLWKKRYAKRFSAIYAASLIFFAGIPINSLPYIPEYAFGLLAAAAVLLGGYFFAEYRKKLLWLCGIFTAVSVAATVLGFVYGGKFGERLYPYEAEGFFAAFVPYAIAETVALATAVAIFAVIRKAQFGMIEKCVGWQGDYGFEGKQGSAVKKRLKKRVTATFVLQCIYAAASVAAIILSPLGDISTIYSMGWVARLVLCAAMTISAEIAGDGILSETEK